MWDETPPLSALQDAIADPTHPIGMRMRAAYFLRHLHTTEPDRQLEIVTTLTVGLADERHGSLMRHEFAYVMGQLRDERCCPTLEEILQRQSDCVMVRHEAAEALGAIGSSRSKAVLQKVAESTNELPELTETCQIALELMEWRASGEHPENMPAVCACMISPYSSVDPAPPNPLHEHLNINDLGNILCDASQPMFERYRAMFSLRNRGGEDAVRELCRALTTDSSSALLRHEVAYVLGQLQHPSSVEALEESLRRVDEHKMVRHESAEALGAIDGRWQDVNRILNEFSQDDNDVVRESCLVALDAADYWGHNKAADEPNSESLSFAQQKADQVLVKNHFNIKA